jgi:type I restriction enzyme S subunit
MDRKTIPAEAAMADGRPFVGMEHVDPASGAIGSGAGSRTGEGKGQAFLFDERHVLFGKLRPYLRKIALPEIKGCSSTELVPLLPNPRRLDRAYLFHWVRRDPVIAALMGKNTGARMPRADMSVLMNMSIPLPPLEEQRRIVAVLDRAAAIRRRADAARTQARALIPALFLDMFGRRGGAWPEITIADVLADQDNAIRTGPFGSQLKHSEFTEDGVPVLGIDNVVDNEFKWAKPRHLPPERYQAFRRFRVFPGDVIVTIMGTTGRVCVAPDDLPECMNTKHLCAFTLDRSRAHPRFVWGAMLFDPDVRAQARGKANGQIMEGWNMGIVRSMRIPLPPLPIQTAFAEQAIRIESVACALDAAAAKAEALAAALSAEVFD